MTLTDKVGQVPGGVAQIPTAAMHPARGRICIPRTPSRAAPRIETQPPANLGSSSPASDPHDVGGRSRNEEQGTHLHSIPPSLPRAPAHHRLPPHRSPVPRPIPLTTSPRRPSSSRCRSKPPTRSAPTARHPRRSGPRPSSAPSSASTARARTAGSACTCRSCAAS